VDLYEIYVSATNSLRRGGSEQHLVKFNIYAYPNQPPNFFPLLEDQEVKVLLDGGESERRFVVKLPPTVDPDQDPVTIEIMTNLQELGFISYN